MSVQWMMAVAHAKKAWRTVQLHVTTSMALLPVLAVKDTFLVLTNERALVTIQRLLHETRYSSMWLHADVDECAVDNGRCNCDPVIDEGDCEATCINSPGMYECSCNDGYFLDADRITCKGMLYLKVTVIAWRVYLTGHGPSINSVQLCLYKLLN